MHRAASRFWECFETLPESIQRLARRNFKLLKADPQHPSLYFKKIGKFWSVRVGLNYRAHAVEDGEHFIWVWISTHDTYERMIK